MHIKRDFNRFLSFYYCFYCLGLKNLRQTFVHKYIGHGLHSKKDDRFFAVLALRLLKYAEPKISYSKSNVLSLL